MKISVLSFAIIVSEANAFVIPQQNHGARTAAPSLRMSTPAATSSEQDFATIFDFTRPETIESFDRIDDVVMGGISSSTIRSVDGEYASWSGVCRTDGGGFCGTRTLPFEEPLQVNKNAEGLFVDCRLTSDDEPERRVWKVSTRTERSRGEELYQAEFELPKAPSDKTEWSRVQLPFNDFQKVRGARYVPDAEKMNVSSGIYQIGLTLSKFVLAQNMTELENFRAGFFELQIKSIGVYFPSEKQDVVSAPKTLSKEEMERKRPLALKLLLPAAKLFFSEQSQRRKSAMRILREKRGLSRARAILFGIGVRNSGKSNVFVSILQAIGIVGVDTFRFIVGKGLRYTIFLPLGLINRLRKIFKKSGSASKALATSSS